MKTTMRNSLFLFAAGALLYPLLEILYRGYSHVSMAILGGLALAGIDLVRRSLPRLRLVPKALICAVLITQAELITGLLLNVRLDLGIWDYSRLPFNLAGQICPLFSFYWFLLSLAALFLLTLLERKGIFPRRLFSPKGRADHPI